MSSTPRGAWCWRCSCPRPGSYATPEQDGRASCKCYNAAGRSRTASRRCASWSSQCSLGGLAKEAIDRLGIQRLVDVGLPEDIDEVLVIGAIVAANSLVGAFMLSVAKKRARGSSVVPAMAVLLVGVAGGILLLAHMQILALAGLGLILQGGFSITTVPLVTTWANTFAASENRATVHSFVGQAEAFGEILGGIALGALAQLTTVPTAMTASAALFLVAAYVASTARYHWFSGL